MWAETFKPCSLRRMGFSEHEPWILPRFPAEFFSLLFFFFSGRFFSGLRSDSILCIRVSQLCSSLSTTCLNVIEVVK